MNAYATQLEPGGICPSTLKGRANSFCQDFAVMHSGFCRSEVRLTCVSDLSDEHLDIVMHRSHSIPAGLCA